MKQVLVCLLLLASYLAVAELFAKTDTQSFPCNWRDDLKITKVDDQIYQCTSVGGNVMLSYSVKQTASSDAFQLLLFNSTEYANYQRGLPFNCINEPQCRLGDSSLKQGKYDISSDVQDFFAVIRDKNFVERAFVNAQVQFNRF